MGRINSSLQVLINTIVDNGGLLLVLILGLWGIQIINKLMSYRLNYFGIIPRTPIGLVGIFLSPFLHGDNNHLFLNTIPLLVLACLVLTGGQTLFWQVSLSIILISGVLIWLLGRKAIHIGASSLIMGYWGYLIVNAYHNPGPLAFILAGVCVYYFGGLLFGLFPSQKSVSWEGHLFGCLAGIITNYIFPMPVL
jgi:membrane associated rhomboid family serine protease